MRILPFYNGFNQTPMELFFAIRRIVVLNKLADKRDYWHRDISMVASGDQLAKLMEPNRNSFASYYLMDVRDDLNALKDIGFIGERTRQEGPSGYGDDQEFYLTSLAMEFCNGKSEEEIRRYIAKKINGDFFGDSDWIDSEGNPI